MQQIVHFTFGNKSLNIFFIFNKAYFSSTNNNVINFVKIQAHNKINRKKPVAFPN